MTSVDAKFDADLINISEVTSRKTKWPRFFGLPCRSESGYRREQREVAFILDRREVVDVAPVVVEHTETGTAELI